MTLFQPIILLRSFLVVLVWLAGLVGAQAQSTNSRVAQRNERMLRRIEKRMHADGERKANLGFKAIFQKGVFAIENTAAPKRTAEPSIIASKVYADFHADHVWHQHHCQYGLTVLLNRYQINSADQPSPLRSQSLFVLHPTFAGTHVSSEAHGLEWEYRTSLHMAMHPSVERQVEFLSNAAPLRVWKSLGWVGQIALRWKLSAAVRSKQRHH